MYKFLTKNGQTIAFGVGALLVILFYAIVVNSGDYDTFNQMDADGVKDKTRYDMSLFDFGIFATIGLILVGAILWAVFTVISLATNIKDNLGMIIGIVLILILFFVGYSMTELGSSGIEYDASQKFGLTDNVRKIIGGSIFTGLTMIALAGIGLVVSEIRNFFK